MLSKVRKLAVIFVLILSLAGSLVAQDEASLKATFQAALEALTNKDLDNFLSYWHPQAVLSSRNRIHAIDKAKIDDRVWRQDFEALFDKVYSVGYTMQAVDYRVVGDTGIVWGLMRLAVDTRKEGGFDQETRLSAVFVRTGDEWKILHWSDSPLPSGQKPIVP